MKTAVLYYSQTGNTAKVGAAIAAAIEAASGSDQDGSDLDPRGCDDLVLAPISEALPLDSFDLLFVGMPIIKFGAPDQARAFLTERCAGRRVALFLTHAAPMDLPGLQPWLDACRDAASTADVVGLFHCPGQLAEPVKQWLTGSGMTDLVRFAEMSASTLGQPDEADLANAADFAREVVGRVRAEHPAERPLVTA